MILVIHGNNLVSSRNFYFGEKNKTPDAIILNGESLTFDTFFQNAENNSLFDERKIIFLENFLSKNKQTSLEFKKIIEYLNKNKNLDVVLFESSEASKSTLS